MRPDLRDGARSPRLGSAETAPAALREKLIPMRDTPDRQLQLDFQRRAPEPAPIAPTSRPERAPHFTTLGSLRSPGPRLGDRRFIPIRTVAPAASDAPFPLPRRRVNDAGFNASPEHLLSARAAASPAPAFASTGLARPVPPLAATNSVPERARRHSPTSAIDAKPEHTGERSLPGAPPLFTGGALRLAALRRCETAPTAQVPESAPC
jgi:hypothetical protein